MVTREAAGLTRTGATGTNGRIVTVRAVLHGPQLPTASLPLTCHEYVPKAIAGGVVLVVVRSAEVKVGLEKAASLSYSNWYFAAVAAAAHEKAGVPMTDAALAGVLKTGAMGPVVSTVKERYALHGPATLR